MSQYRIRGLGGWIYDRDYFLLYEVTVYVTINPELRNSAGSFRALRKGYVR